MGVEEKWKMNAKKVAFVKAFPGRLHSSREAVGKRIEQVFVLEKGKTEVVVFSDATFLVLPNPDARPAVLIRALLKANPALKKHHEAAYRRLDALIEEDRALQRQARLDNILGAVRNNYPHIPELAAELKQFLEEIASDSEAQKPDKTNSEKTESPEAS